MERVAEGEAMGGGVDVAIGGRGDDVEMIGGVAGGEEGGEERR